ncbi:SDR family NAD(P)-dependent oxidoreductase [Vannielia litorea]|uniref:SDR family NAD(P)-dependent oxidoreductase n=1 Tax=Vannielia litorea TaxID=1217970 RepID=UPI001C94EC67|nr:SDR family NAD(P)-dependent oxidoreductase [Vannielia litorea]MBY6048250.1 SDR family oxidoreductase [Vannielia litorea]MBY6075664.1 SDR family oxidoreductase [Vannielia litorea]
MTDIFPNRFAGRKAIITGGASGIGLAAALRMQAEGATVTVWDVNEAALAAAEAEGLTPGLVDVTNPEGTEAAMQAAATAMGGLDILVCSAGITGPNVPTWEYPLDDWHAVTNLNFHGVFYCNRVAAPLMKAAGYGRIVNIASVAGKEGNPNAPAYSATKAAVIGLTKSLGKELADTAVTVNCIAPAAVESPIFDQMTPEFIAFMKSKIPMGRFGTTDEIAAMICWLASPEASFTTGACFDQSGGRATF